MQRVERIAIIIGSLLWILVTMSFIYAKKEEAALAQSLVRFHVLANSDDEEDQALKLRVRDAVLETLKADLLQIENVQEAKQYLQQHLGRIEETANQTIVENGYNYKAKVTMEETLFPSKGYANVKLPAGYYQSLRIEIGNAGGRNWWCVMFPPLCYSMEEEQLPDRMERLLEKTLDEETNQLIHYEEGEPTIQVRFKIVEWWNQLEQWITS